MPAMPSSASLAPGLNAIAAKLLPGSNGADVAATAANGADLFAAHFQRLLGKQLAIEVDTGQIGQMTDPAASGNAPADELAALLPFIEALGLTQVSADPATEVAADNMEASSVETIIDAAGALLAAPASLPTASTPPGSPAISAANPSAQGQAHGFAFNLQAQSTSSTDAAEVLPNAMAGNGAPAEELSAGREFSSQLVAAIAANKESPGTTATAVQNIVSQMAPGRMANQETAPVISQAVGAPGWTEELGNHVTWLANRAESRAELVLTPPQMGRIEVNLSIKGDQATASFASSNPVVREALEAALPRLREVLADAGIQLGQAQVNAENARQWAQQEKHGDNSGSDHARANPVHEALSSASSGNISTTSGLKGGRGLVDVFA
ncbi:MAG: flagellar hook-length control protein FliK [Pseudomonadota bacterium]